MIALSFLKNLKVVTTVSNNKMISTEISYNYSVYKKL